MNAAELATDGLASQEMESLAGCVARGQAPDTYADVVAKLRGHAEKLPEDRRTFWAAECRSIGVELFPAAEPEVKDIGFKRRRGRDE